MTTLSNFMRPAKVIREFCPGRVTMAGMQRGAAEQALIERARAVLPAGNFGNMASEMVMARAKNGRIWDLSGNEYVDFLLGSGPMFIGHDHPEVTAAVQAQIPKGTTFFANNEHGIALAEVICEAMACADKVRFVSTGSEAMLYAMRTARAHRKRDKILKFEGGFHGMSDYALMSMAPKRLSNYPQALPDSPGIPKRISEDVIIAPYNDAETARALIAEYHDQLGAVVAEPFQRMLPPKPGFLETLREVTSEYDIPLIFDEIVTGFRFASGGAQAYYGVTPDMCGLGKIIGGGFPLAAICGSDELMAHFDKRAVDAEDFLPQIGTLSGNPVAAVAGLKTLEILKRPGVYEKVFETGQRLMEGLQAAMHDNGHAAKVIGEPPLFDVFFTDGPVENYRGMAAADANKNRAFTALLRDRGIFKGDVKYYISLAHDEDDIQQTLEAFKDAAKVLAEA
jgi:glutamate-1-semialdehyde 2,1-aminomutase